MLACFVLGAGDNERMSILVIGGTGNVGRQVVAQLAEMRVPVRAMVRNPPTAGLPAGVEVCQGDLTIPGTLDGALHGVDAVFLVWMAPENAVDAALERVTRAARRIVYLSAPFKTQHPFFQKPQPNPITALNVKIETAIEASGREWTFLRPGMFTSNSFGFWAGQMRAGDLVRWPYLDSETAPIDERDIAAVAVRSLREDWHDGEEYVITGPESLTQREQVEIIARAAGRKVRVEEISPEEARVELPARGFPAEALNHLLPAWSAGVGIPAYMTQTVEEVTGRPARRFAEWAADHLNDFR
jgi:uncharacterized protein YbjT (DUF2867 family)